MVNPTKVNSMMRNLEATVARLRQIAQIPRAAFLADAITLGGAKYYLQIAIENCIDIANHIISSEYYRAPKDYRDVFSVLAENKIVPEDYAAHLRQMAGLRNRLVHLYWEVDDELIYDVLQNDLGDFDRFIKYILAFGSQG
jgi:uncharacterized protein YutE (UPF0331/DUF86 family)